MVFVYHNRKYWRGDVPEWLLRLMNEGHMGVTLFFVLSGYLIASTYRDEPLTNGRSYLSYALTRLARIMPVYWLILTARYTDYGFPAAGETLQTYSLLHAFSDLNCLDGISQSWTLNLELCFYALAPFIFRWMLQKPLKAWLISAALFIPAFITGWAWTKINGNPQSFFSPWQFLLHSTYFGRFPEFLIGVMLAGYQLKPRSSDAAGWAIKTAGGLAGMVFTLWLMGQMQPDMFHHGADHPLGPLVRSFVFPAFTAIFFLGLMQEKNLIARFLGSRVLVLLGNASFAFYLIHISYVNIRLRQWHLFPDRNYILLWIAAIIIYLLFEKPVYAWLRRLIRRINGAEGSGKSAVLKP